MTFTELNGQFLTVAEVAEILRLNQQTVRNWIDQGSLPAIRVGRRVRIKRTDLDRVIARGYQAAPLGMVASDGPSAADFWGGEPVGGIESDAATQPGAALAERSDSSVATNAAQKQSG